MYKRILVGVLVGVLTVGLTGSAALAFGCPGLVAEGRALAAKAKGPVKEKALKLLAGAEKAHNGGEHGTAVEMAKEAIASLKPASSSY